MGQATNHTPAVEPDGFLSTRKGGLTLALLCVAAFLDFADSSIVNMALPSIHRELHVSVQNVQWVLGGYLVTFGGFLLLGGRAADLLGRRRMLVAGTAVFAIASLAGGFADTYGLLVASRLAKGLGAAFMSPAALSALTTTFSSARERTTALGAWGAMAGLGSAVGVLAGGALTGGPGWRWVFFVPVPLAALILVGSFRLLKPDERAKIRFSDFDAVGAGLVTSGTLLLIYALVNAPTVGWGTTRTIGQIAGAVLLLVAFVANEARNPNPLVPLSIFRLPGVAAADATQAIAMAGFASMFFFVTLYMQGILHYSPIDAGLAYIPVTVGIGGASVLAARLVPRLGTRPVIMAGAVVSGASILWLSRISVHATYVADLLAPLFFMAAGFGMLFVGVQIAANGGIPADKAGVAAALINASYQVGGAIGLAVFSAIATAHTHHLAGEHVAPLSAVTGGYQWALVACGVALLAAALIGTRVSNVRTPGPKGEASEHLDIVFQVN